MSEDGKTTLTIRLFGTFEASVGETPLPPLRSQKGRQLLALLALRQGKEVPRAWLAETLWPDSLLSNALTSLRQSLADLRRAFGDYADAFLTATPRALGLKLESVCVDVRAFDRAAAKGDADSLQQAVGLYRGPLLEAWSEPWILAERESRRLSYLKALETLAAQAAASGREAEASDFLRRGIAADPTNERLHHALLKALARQGDYGSAAQVYQALRRRLHEELHTQPSPELQALYQEIRAEAERHAATKRPDPPAVSTPPPFHVPRPLTPLIGREAETRALIAQLATARLVTLVGMGGVGKTRLAVHVATALAEEYADGIWFVDLSALTIPDLVPQQVALTLGISEERGRARLQTLLDFLQPKQLLLLLDNCESLAAACAELASALLSSCPGLRLLATSRRKLGLPGESVSPVSGLSLPETEACDLETLIHSEAVRLFVARAQAVRPDFALTEHNAPAVARLCALLDGLPLALELAAALVESRTPDEIVARLEAGLDFPPGDDPTRPRRHRTLEALLESSYAVLAPPEQALLRRGSVFAGGWTLSDAELVCPLESPLGQTAPCDLLPLLSRLVAASLVTAEASYGRTRYRMPALVHRYAAQQLERSGEIKTLRRRHCDHFLKLAEEAERRLTGPEQAHWLQLLDESHDNLRAALAYAETTDATTLLRLVDALGRFRQIRGYWSEGREWIDQALRQAVPEEAPALRAEALNWASLLATYQGDISAGQAYAEQGRALWESLSDTRGIANSLGCLGIVAANRGDYTAAASYHARSLELARAIKDACGTAGALGYLGNIATAQGDFEAARRYYTESLALRRALQDTWGVAASLNNLGLLAYRSGEWAEARRFLEESLALRRELGDKRCIAITLNLLGLCACAQAEADRARAYLHEGLELCERIGDKRSVAYALESLASLAFLESRPERAARLLGTASALREAIASPLPPSEQPANAERKRALQDTLGNDAFAAQWNAGRALSPLEALGEG